MRRAWRIRAFALGLCVSPGVASAQTGEQASDALASVVISGAVRPRVRFASDGRSMNVTLHEQELQFTFARLDGEIEPAFEPFRAGMRSAKMSRPMLI